MMQPQMILPSASPSNAAPSSELYELTDTDTMPEVLSALKRARPSGRVRLSDHRELPASIVGVSDGGVQLSLTEPIPSGPGVLHFELHGVVFVLHGVLARADAWQLSGPWRLYSLDQRAVTRLSLPAGFAELWWHSAIADDVELGRGRVHDLSPAGAGISLDGDSQPPPNGPFPAALRVGHRTIPCLAEARRRPEDPEGVYGIQLRTPGLHRGLIDVYLNARLPQLCARAEVDPQALQSLMQQSKYLDLRQTSAQFERWRTFESEETLSYDRVYRARDGKYLGHVSATRIYSRTWLLHQLASLGGHAESGEARMAIYMMVAALPVLYEGSHATVLAYFDQANRWHQLFLERFVKWIDDDARANICSLDRFERDDPPEPFACPEHCEVKTLHETELVEACALVRSHLPAVTAEAMDIDPDRLHQPATRPDGRGRTVFVLREHGQLAGVALCETGDQSLSLFNIVNMAQLYLRTGRRKPSLPAQRALIAAARAYYEHRAVTSPMLVAPAGTLQGTAEPGTRLAESMGCFTVTGRSVRQWENYCRFHFGRRWRRHQTGAKSL